MSAYEKGGQWQRALELLEGMPQWALKPDVISYNAAMSACDEVCKWQRTIELLERMLQRGLDPAESSYSSAIGACAPGRQLLGLASGLASAVVSIS